MPGDYIESALQGVGISKERVQRWAGDCCCEARKQKMNELDHWSRQSVKIRLEMARRYLNEIIGVEE